MDSARHESRSIRGKLVAVLAIALAFAAGLALRLSTDESHVVVPSVTKRADGAGAPQPIRLVRIDPGALRRPALRSSDGGTAVSAQPGSAPGPVAGPVAPAPGSALLAPEASDQSFETRGNATFDSAGLGPGE